jgi:hypothetical protein
MILSFAVMALMFFVVADVASVNVDCILVGAVFVCCGL